MAKKSSGSGGLSLSKIGFWSIVLVAVAYAITLVFSKIPWFSWDWVGTVTSWLTRIAVALMAIVVCFVAYGHVRGRKDIGTHILYWICVIIVIVTLIWVIFPF